MRSVVGRFGITGAAQTLKIKVRAWTVVGMLAPCGDGGLTHCWCELTLVVFMLRSIFLMA